MSPGIEALPWRGPGPDRPDDLRLPPQRLRLRSAGTMRKRWRYLGAFADEFMLCAARVKVGPAMQTFWALYDRREDRMLEHTVTPWPGARGEVWSEDGEGVGVIFARNGGTLMRIQAKDPEAGEIRCFLRTGSGVWVESVCPTEAGAYVWTRKRVVPVSCDIRIGDRRIEVEATGIEDESAGYHPRHTVWSWSAGVGRLADGRPVGWNLVEGVNDPPERSERAVWVDGEPFEPAPVSFEGLEAVAFGDGARLEFAAEAERVAEEERRFVRVAYRQPFGTFRGTLEGGLELDRGLGVMEHQDALW
jgi:Protein of unknown function (DUF2804)